jgi:hypothetical protein
MRTVIICTLHQLLFGGSNEMGGTCSEHSEIRNVFQILVEKPDHLGNVGVYEKIILKWILNKYDVRV